MARIRSIKPDFWSSKTLAKVSKGGRLTFIGLLSLCDEKGMTDDFPKRIAGNLYPFEEIGVEIIDSELDELVLYGFLKRIVEGNKNKIKVIDFCNYKILANRPNAHEWRAIKNRIFKRDKFACTYCGKSNVRLECDHINPLFHGGTNDDENLTTACFKCNRSKGKKTINEWRLS